LDGQLNPSDATRLEARLKTDSQLAKVLSDLRSTRSLLRKLPQRRAPRNFTLTRKMVGQNPPLPRTYPLFRFASALATLLFFFSFGLNAVGRYAAQPPAFGMGGGGGGAEESTELFSQAAPAAEAPAATEAPAEEPSVGMVPAPTQMPPAEDQARLAEETPVAKEGETGNAVGQPDQFQVQTEAQRPAPLVSSAWQIGLLAAALGSALLMWLTRRRAVDRWR
jgi:anti-sigma factor RsiW